MDSQNKNYFQIGSKECGLLCGTLGAVIALFLILFGLWNTILIVLLFGCGYFIGACDHKVALLKTAINKFFPSKGE